MADLSVEPVESRRQQKQFFQFPWRHYASDDNWVPPLRTNQLELLGYKTHPFFREAEIQTFIALRGGEVCGRIAAIVHHAHNRYYKEQRGFFGFFESIDDLDVAGRLFDAAADWHREQGMTNIRGPMNPSFNYEMGMLIDGFDEPPVFLMTYNPAYYPRLLDQLGFVKAQDMYAYRGRAEQLGELDPKVGRIIDQCIERFKIDMRPLDRRRFAEDIDKFMQVYNQSFQGHWGFVPLSDHEMEHLGASLRHLIVPELTCIAEIDGKAIGSAFCLPDYNPRIKKIDGRLFPLGFARLLWNRKAIKKIRVISTNVVPEFQLWAVGVAMLHQLTPAVYKWGIREAEFSWVMESNRLSKGTLERGNVTRQKTYRIYDKSLVN